MTLPVAIFTGCPLVMLFLALGEADFEFRPTSGPMQIEWHECESFALHRADESIQFMTLQQ